MTETPDTEKLIRYLDGELDEAEAAATEAQMGRDREFARLAGELQQSTMLLHAAFEQAVRAPLPAKLRGVVDAGLAPRMKAPRRRMFRRSGGLGWGAAAAASFAALLVGVLGGYIAGIGANVAPDGALTALSSHEITATLVGNTILGKGKVSAYIIYYQSPGELRGKIVWNGDTATDRGVWEVTADNMYCRRWIEKWGSRERKCWRIYRDGDTITWIDTDGVVSAETTLVPGNVESL